MSQLFGNFFQIKVRLFATVIILLTHFIYYLVFIAKYPHLHLKSYIAKQLNKFVQENLNREKALSITGYCFTPLLEFYSCSDPFFNSQQKAISRETVLKLQLL